MTVAVTGGGTGGHIYPALSVARALPAQAREVSVVYIGAENGMEAHLASEWGIPFVGVPARKIRRLASLDTLVTLAVLYRGYRRARAALRRDRPAALLGTGGYVAAAATIAAHHERIPVVIHEQNAVAGRTNRWLAARAQRICLSFECSQAAFPADRTVVTGLPTRSDIVSSASREDARRRLSVPTDAFTLLVLGGSQGAAAVNRVVWDALPSLPEHVSVLHQTGPRSSPEPVPSRHGYVSRSYFDAETLPIAFRAADLVLSRCGASTLAETAMNGLPALLVPYPAAYADHQTANARAVSDAGAGILIPQATLTASALTRQVQELMGDPERLARMSAASASLARPDAAARVARVVLECAGA